MAKTKIEWTEETWNPITGCTKLSSGCQHCYAASFARRLQAMGNVRYTNGFKVTMHEDLFEKPLEWKRPRMIFVNSMSDIFHEDVPDRVILKLFDTMNRASWHTFQILTKRTERLINLSHQINWSDNIWMGVTVENSDTLGRADALRLTGAHVKFISAEPLLSPLQNLNLDGIDWLIVGGESGPEARPIQEDWVIQLRDKAKMAKTAFFFKQWGGTRKKKNGSLLQGEHYKEYPNV